MARKRRPLHPVLAAIQAEWEVRNERGDITDSHKRQVRREWRRLYRARDEIRTRLYDLREELYDLCAKHHDAFGGKAFMLRAVPTSFKSRPWKDGQTTTWFLTRPRAKTAIPPELFSPEQSALVRHLTRLDRRIERLERRNRELAPLEWSAAREVMLAYGVVPVWIGSQVFEPAHQARTGTVFYLPQRRDAYDE
jgi:hypothetical protein